MRNKKIIPDDRIEMIEAKFTTLGKMLSEIQKMIDNNNLNGLAELIKNAEILRNECKLLTNQLKISVNGHKKENRLRLN